MAKITMRVVDASIADESGRRFIVWDSEIKGFGLLVLPSGVKSYFYRYRTPEGRERRFTIGKHGAYTAEEARARADELKRQVRLGKDPLAEKDALRNAAMVGDLLDSYLKSEKFKSKADSTRSIDKGRIERHLRPLLGRMHAHTLTANDIEKAMSDIRDGKTVARETTIARGLARVRGGAGTARMAIDLLRSIFTWGVRERLVSSNPCIGVKTGVSGTRETILESADEYAQLFGALQEMEDKKLIRQPAADAIRLIALTGARRGEVASLKWRNVDLKKGLIVLPPNSHKTGRATGKPRVIGLPAAAQAIIARQSDRGMDTYVFEPARTEMKTESGPISLSKPWRMVRAKAKLPSNIGLHGLRHSLASHMAMNGAEAAEIMTALGHRQLSTAQRYVHWAQDGRQALAEKAARTVLTGIAINVQDATKEKKAKGRKE